MSLSWYPSLLRESEERFRSVSRAPADAISWSEGMQLLFVHALDTLEADSRLWTRRFHPDGLKRVLDSIHGVIDGRWVVVSGRWALFRDADGRPSAIFGVGTDVTARLGLEAQLQQARRLAT